MSAVNVTLTLPEGTTNYSHNLNSTEKTLPALRQAIKNCQTQINQILTEVVENDRTKAKNAASNGGDEKSKALPEDAEEDDDDDEEEEGEEDDLDDDGAGTNGTTLEAPAKKQKLES